MCRFLLQHGGLALCLLLLSSMLVQAQDIVGIGLTFRDPLDIAAELADITPEFVAAEQIVLDYVRGPGQKTPAGLAAARREFQAVVARLTERVKRGK